MKKAGRPRAPASSISTSTLGIVAERSFNHNQSIVSGASLLSGAVCALALQELDDLLADFDAVDDTPTLTKTVSVASPPSALQRLVSANFVNRPMTRSDRSRALNALLHQGFDRWEAGKILVAEEHRRSVRGSTQHPSTSKKLKATEDNANAGRPATSISARAIAAAKTRANPAASKTKRHITDDVRLGAYHDAIATLGHAVAVTLRLRTDIEAKARQIGQEGGDPLDWLRRRINHELAKLPGAIFGSVWLWGVESKGGQSWHLHGELAVGELKQLPEIEEALLQAIGAAKDKRFRQRQVKLKRHANAAWLAVYGEQNILEARKVRVPGSLVVASGNVKTAATKAKRRFSQTS